MKIKLTRKWKKQRPFRQSTATCGIIFLLCQPTLWTHNEWVGRVSMCGFKRSGPPRRSEQKAKQDAERLAVELLLDIRDGTKALMDKYGIGEDD